MIANQNKGLNSAKKYYLRRPLKMTILWISEVPSYIDRALASLYSCSIKNSFEYPYPP
jgi:hypothetical protein